MRNRNWSCYRLLCYLFSSQTNVGALLCIRAVASSGTRGRREAPFFRSAFERLLANSLSHTSWNIFYIETGDSCRSLPPPTLLLERKKLIEVSRRTTKSRHIFHHFRQGICKNRAKEASFSFRDKTRPFCICLWHTAFQLLPSPTQTESRAHRTLSLNPTHQGPETLLWRIFF